MLHKLTIMVSAPSVEEACSIVKGFNADVVEANATFSGVAFEEKAVEVLLLCKGNAQMALGETWDKSDAGFESQIDICLDALALANPALVHLVDRRLEAEGIPPFAQEGDE